MADKSKAVGGHARARALTAERRKAIAQIGARARWAAPRKPGKQPRRVALFLVKMVLPPEATLADARAYIEDAVCTMKGCLQPAGYGPGGPNPDEPGDPMQPLDPTTVRVTQVKV